MANFTLEKTRNDAFTNIPRLTFQKPQSTTGATPSTTDPILFCQTGCDLEFKFKNITSAKMKNDGAYFTITPPDNSDNYINWSGSGKAGFDMIRFDLKEIKIAAPARDVVGSINYSKSIQIYFSFVNSDENKRDIMIVISIIGQANNVGNAQTDGFILLNELIKQIPVRNEIRAVTNLKNVTVGNLLPSSKAFFNTLIDAQKIYYISMARIIDIPENFLNEMISRVVVGGPQAYQSKVSQNTQQIPSNPQGTIIFYSENLKTIGSDQAYVCNANCDRVVGDASLLQPTFGSSTDTRMAGTSTRTAPGAPGAPTKEVPCEEEYVYPGTKSAVKINSASAPATSTDKTTDKSNEKELTKQELGNVWVLAAFVAMILALTCFILAAMAVASGVTSFLGFFSRELWNVPNIPFILAGLIGAISVITGVSITIVMIEQENSKSTENEKEKKPYIGLIVGLSIWLLCFIPLAIFAVKAKAKRYSNSSFGYSSINSYSSNSFSQQNPFALPINPALPEFDPAGKIKPFNTQVDKILSSYKSSPSPTDFLKPGSSGIQDILAASKQYRELSPIAKGTMAKYNPSLVPYLNPKGQFIQNIQSTPPETLKSYIESLNYYNLMSKRQPIVSSDLIYNLQKYQSKKKNSDLEKIIKGLIVGAPIPIEVYKYVSKI